jgi:hypothetical protein
MAFSRHYTAAEVEGMLRIFGGNRAITGRDPQTHHLQRANAPAHAQIHGGANMLEQRQRVNTPGEPRNTGTYWTEADQVAATTEVLNSDAGRIALRRLDIGEQRAAITASLTPGRYRVAQAGDRSNMPNMPGHLGRDNPGRAGAGATHTQGHATKGFVLAVKGVGGLLQIQTSYPCEVL